MSQWNNSYYNSQYQGPNEWNAGSNQQYVDQNVYYQGGQFDPGSQYVSFNDFITQMQGASGANVNTSNYNNQYQYSEQYNVNQYNQSEASTSQATVPIASYDAVAGPSSESNHQPSYNDGTQIEETHNHKTKKPFKSKLTPTASEFVPKNSVKHSNTYSNKSAESGTNYNNESKNYSRSNNSDSNWRERPSSSSHGNNHNNGSSNHSNGYNYKNQDNKNRETNYNRNRDSSPRVQDSNSKNDSRNESSNKYQKSGSKSKNRDVDSGRTFYSSSSAKSNHDNRNGRWEGGYKGKNWGGSQRLRAMDRNSADDEQYANTYLQHREDRERDKRETERPGKGRSGSSPARSRNKQTNLGGNQDTAKELTQRERLIDQLDKGTLECLVCCERVRQTDTVWSCSNCFHVLHLRCIRKWAMSSLLDGKWRCPACQNVSDTVPTEYRCMCGAVRNPEWQRGACGAHTCGRACKRPRSCPHPCTLLCHPGPCPPCQATVNKQCGCGAETRSVLCSSKLVQVCGRVCGRTLSCELHKCTKDCHEGPCDECDKTIDQVCHCPGVKSRTVPCTRHTSRTPHYSCGDACGRVLACGAHVCRAPCHPPPCPDCDKSPERLDTCPCGKIKLEKGARKSCTSPIPLCGNICARPLPCGPQGDRHFCKQECHEGECPPCPDKTVLQCRCGHSSREVPCTDLPQVLGNVFCQRKCNKKLSCGRHRCREQCCALESHRCGVVCGRSLSCQLHRCEELCHTGHCAPCPRLGFTELRCACGLQVALPPLACGARAPPCSAACPRRRECGHEPHHSCHTGACPPCVVLTTKRCYGGHEERKTIPCSQEEFSCGMACGKPLPCGKHTCIKVCHKGPCDTEKCVQPCRAVREACGHACAAACHAAAGGPCPAPAPCRALVRAHCACGRRHQPALCADNMARRNEILAALAATKMQDGGTVDLSEVNRPSNNLKTLECDDECRVEQRTRQMALALQIRNPDISSKLAPKYSEHVRQWATKEPSFAQSVHNNLTNLVQLAKKSKQKTRSHSFPSMNRQKRQFIHEMCEHFGCESVAYDAEPNRNVVATADKEKSWLPAMSVLEVLSREAGRRRVPGPVLRAPPAPAAAHAAAAALAPAAAPASSSRTGWTTLKPTNPWATRSQPSQSTTSNQEPPAAPKIDYFDNPPE